MGSPSKYDEQAELVRRELELEKSEPPLERAADDYFQWRDAHAWVLRGVALLLFLGTLVQVCRMLPN